MRLSRREGVAYLLLCKLEAAADGLSTTELAMNNTAAARDMREALICGGYIRTEPFIGGGGSVGTRHYITDDGRRRLKGQRKILAAKPPKDDD